jgi:ribonuclease Z
MEKIIFLGTSAGHSYNFYNACFLLQKNAEYMLIDGGGGNTILKQLKILNIDGNNIKNIFVTHSHLDHIIGIVWVIRKIETMMRINKYEGNLNIYASDITIDAIRTIANLTSSANYNIFLDNRIILNVVKDREEVNILNEKFIFYDINAQKEKQFGFKIIMEDNKTLVCNGDEPLNEINYDLVKNADYLIHEAMCLDSEKEVKQPYRKGHSTAKDACDVANSLNVKNLILYHISNDDVENRKIKFLSENEKYFKGNLYVPNDLEIIDIKVKKL